MTNPVFVTAGSAWPALPLEAWQDTCQTLHMWTQIVGKVRMALSPPLNHWWHTTLYVNARGLTVDKKPLGDLTATATTRGQAVAFNLQSDLAHSDIRGSARGSTLQLASGNQLRWAKRATCRLNSISRTASLLSTEALRTCHLCRTHPIA